MPESSDRSMPLSQAFSRNERGATAIEYALIAGLISVGILGAVMATGSSLEARYDAIERAITTAVHNLS